MYMLLMRNTFSVRTTQSDLNVPSSRSRTVARSKTLSTLRWRGGVLHSLRLSIPRDVFLTTVQSGIPLVRYTGGGLF